MRGSTPKAAQPRVLVVDSDRLNRAIAREALQNDGFSVLEADDGRSALESFFAHGADLVVLDLGEPSDELLEVCRTVRLGGRELPIPILVVVKGDDPALIDDALEAGASDFVVAPVRWRLIGARARYLLRRQQERVGARERNALPVMPPSASSLGSWQWHGATKAMHWSPMTFRVLGVDPDRSAPSYERFWECIHPDERDQARREVEEALASCGRFASQYRVVYEDGDVRTVALYGERVGPPSDPEAWIAGTVQDVTDQRLPIHASNNSDYDSLTGLANRRLFTERLERDIASAAEGDHALALLYVDLDRFKRVNDTFGRAVGDSVIKVIADRLMECVGCAEVMGERGSGGRDPMVARMGGDEFTILLSRIPDTATAGEVAGTLLRELEQPVFVDGVEVVGTTSIGIALYPGDGQSADALIRHADRATHAAKQQGRNAFEFYASSMDKGTSRLLELESRLRHALDRGEFRVLYQPKVDTKTRLVTGMEALLRWTDEVLGAVSPSEFIPICEDTGLIIPIGEWVLQTACKQTRAWQLEGYEPIRVAVNASITQFQRTDLPDVVAKALRNTDLDPTCLEIEITESVMLQDAEAIAIVLRELRHMGVRVALDDFGTGYSSLSFIARLPLDSLKLDRSFVRELDSDPAAAAVATAVIAMAHGLGLSVVAEGVDLEEQVSFLQANACDTMQGFLISGAVSAEDFIRFLRPRKPQDP